MPVLPNYWAVDTNIEWLLTVDLMTYPLPPLSKLCLTFSFSFFVAAFMLRIFPCICIWRRILQRGF